MRSLLRARRYEYRSRPILRRIQFPHALWFSTAPTADAETTVAGQTKQQRPHLYNSLSSCFEPLPANTPLLFFGSSTLEYPDRIGHTHSYVWWDIWRRTLALRNAAWVWCLHDVVFGDGWTTTWDALGLLPPDQILRTSEHIQSTIIPYIQRMIERGAAYRIAVGKGQQQVYCHLPSIRPSNRYGILAPSYTRTIHRYPHDEESRLRDDRDFLLWESSQQDDTGDNRSNLVAWNSPWGQGTPTTAAASAALLSHATLQHTSPHPYVIRVGRADDKVPYHVHEMAVGDSVGAGSVPSHWVHTGVVTELTDYLYASRDHRADVNTVQHDPTPKLRTLLRQKKKSTVAFRDVLRWWALQRNYYESAAPFEYPATMRLYSASLQAVTHFLHAVDALPTSPNVVRASSVTVEQLGTAVQALDLWNSEDLQQRPTSIGGAIDNVVRKGELVLLFDSSTTTIPLRSAARVLREVLQTVGFSPRVWKQETSQVKEGTQKNVRRQTSVKVVPVSTKAPSQQHSLPPERMFIDGLDYAGQFSAFDPTGLPTHAAIDGMPLSQTKRKIFRQLHRKRRKQHDKLAHQRRRKEKEYEAERQPWRIKGRGAARREPPVPPMDDELPPPAPVQLLTRRQERLRRYRSEVRRKKQLHKRG